MTKRIKKIMALSLAMSLVFTSNVFAGSETGTQAVTGTGTTEYVNSTVYDVTLPTSAALDFTLDPQGLLALEDGQMATLEALASDGGKIVSTTSACMINNSSVPIKMTVSINITSDATADTELKQIKTSANEALATLSTNTVPTFLMFVVPSEEAITDASEFVPGSKGIILQKDFRESYDQTQCDSISFVLDAPEYQVSKNGASYTFLKTGDSYGNGFAIGGLLSPNTDWSDFTVAGSKTFGVSTVFNYCKAEADDVATEDSGIYGYIQAEDDLVMEAAGAVAGTKLSVSKISGASATADITWGSATKVTSVQLTKATGNPVTLTSGNHYTVNTSKSTITFNGFMASNVGQKVIVTFDNGTKVTLTIG